MQPTHSAGATFQVSNINNGVLLDQRRLGQQFLNLGRLANQVPVKVLEYPSGLEVLPEVCEALLNDQPAKGELAKSVPSIAGH